MVGPLYVLCCTKHILHVDTDKTTRIIYLYLQKMTRFWILLVSAFFFRTSLSHLQSAGCFLCFFLSSSESSTNSEIRGGSMDMLACKSSLVVLPFTDMVIVEFTSMGTLAISKVAMSRGMSSYVFAVYSYALTTLFLLPCFIFQ